MLATKAPVTQASSAPAPRDTEERVLPSLARPLPPPRLLCARLPVPPPVGAKLAADRRALRDILHGRDPKRLLVIVGPCSIHSREEALGYARRLAPLAREVEKQCLVVMRTYFEKPRSGLGWKGLLNDPHLDGLGDIASGVVLCREILLEIAELGLPCAGEFLDVLAAPYFRDLLTWGAIGARTSASQPHRELVSGLALPVGFKNGTDGDLSCVEGALAFAHRPHHSLGVGDDGQASAIRTRGNPEAHIVLRGGSSGPNHDPSSIARAAATGRRLGLARPVVIDCSHGNSAKDHTRQADVCRQVLGHHRDGQQGIAGVMLESHLRPGNQPFEPGCTLGSTLERGVSITDACMGFEESEGLVREIAGAVSTRGNPV